MLSSSHSAGAVTARISSEQRLVEPVLHLFRRFAEESGAPCVAGLSLAVREALSNAVRHGNHGDARRTVACSMRLINGKRFEVIIEDEGTGFDHACIATSLPGGLRFAQQRGLRLVNALAERMRFNEVGNRLTLLLNLDEATESKETLRVLG